MEHLALEVFDREGTGSKFAVLPENTSITIRRTSQVFGSGDIWSYDFQLNVYANAHIFGTSGEIHGSRLHEQIDKRKARLWAEGVPMYLGYLRLGSEANVDVNGDVDISFESGQTAFSDMIEGAKANQVPLMGDVPIGMALWRKRWTTIGVRLRAYANLGNDPLAEPTGCTLEHDIVVNGSDVVNITCDGEMDDNSVQEYPRMVFPRGHFVSRDGGDDWDENCLNTDYPYDDAHPYCNVALCYQKYDYKKVNDNGATVPDYTGEPEAQREYEYMPADRVNSAPNFYVIYWLRCLMKHLGIHIEENQMMDVEDLRRLFFVNTNCAYEEPKKLRSSEATAEDLRFGRYRYKFDGTISLGGERSGNQLSFDSLIPEYRNSVDQEVIENSKFTGENIRVNIRRTNDEGFTVLSVGAKVVEVVRPTHHHNPDQYKENNNYFHRAYATSECFPNADISDVIEAVRSGFGVRFLFSEDGQRVRIVLLRNLFRSKETQHVDCEIISEEKTENNIRGFRMTYGDSEDTHFYYKGFADKLPHKKPYFVDDSDKHDYSRWNLNADYETATNSVSAFNKTCYVTPVTGNAYGVKVDKDAKRYDDLHPSLFEFAGYMDAEDGDCSGEEDTIETIKVGFTPMIMNDVNKVDTGLSEHRQRFALFVDETMRVRRVDFQDLPSAAQPGVKSYDDPTAIYDINRLYRDDSPARNMKEGGIVKPGEFAITSDTYVAVKDAGFSCDYAMYYGGWWNFDADVVFDLKGHINEGYRLYLQDNYEPNDNGVSPIENHDWGLTLGIMRGSGSDARVDYYDDPDDEENDTWEIAPGSSATAHPDTCDSYGNEWDYVNTRRAGRGEAAELFVELFPDSNASFSDVAYGANSGVELFTIKDNTGRQYKALFTTPFPPNNSWHYGRFMKYIEYLSGHSHDEIKRLDAEGYMDYQNTFVELESSQERCDTLRQLILLALGYESSIVVDHGVGSRFGRFSLKLRAEKPNPYFDPKQPESDSNRRYLQIANKNLRGRGLCDQFYKEYSYWVRNARIWEGTVRMELAQLLTIDDTVRVTVGDLTGFIKEMEFSIDMQNGLGYVKMQIMYI